MNQVVSSDDEFSPVSAIFFHWGIRKPTNRTHPKIGTDMQILKPIQTKKSLPVWCTLYTNKKGFLIFYSTPEEPNPPSRRF